MSLADRCELLRTQLGYEAGTPLIDIIRRAGVDLGLHLEGTLIQQAETCCAAIGISNVVVVQQVVTGIPVEIAPIAAIPASTEPRLVIDSAWYGDAHRRRGKDVTHIVRSHIVNNEVRINESRRRGALNEIFLGASDGCSEPNVRRANGGDSLWFPKCVIVRYQYGTGSRMQELCTSCVAYEPFAVVIRPRNSQDGESRGGAMTAQDVKGCWLAWPGVWHFPPVPCAGAIGYHEVHGDDHLKGIFWSPCFPFVPFIMHWIKEGDRWQGYADANGQPGDKCCNAKREFTADNCACETGGMWTGVVWRIC